MNTENWTPPVSGEYVAYRTSKQAIMLLGRNCLNALVFYVALVIYNYFLQYEKFSELNATFQPSIFMLGIILLPLYLLFVIAIYATHEKVDKRGILYYDNNLFRVDKRWFGGLKYSLFSGSLSGSKDVQIRLIGNHLTFDEDPNKTLYAIPDRFKSNPEKLLMWINEHIANNKKS